MKGKMRRRLFDVAMGGGAGMRFASRTVGTFDISAGSSALTNCGKRRASFEPGGRLIELRRCKPDWLKSKWSNLRLGFLSVPLGPFTNPPFDASKTLESLEEPL